MVFEVLLTEDAVRDLEEIYDYIGGKLALIPVADLFFRSGAILSQAGRFEMVAALLGIILTCVYIIGLLERENRTVLRMGYDSIAAFVIYSIGLATLFTLEDG